MSKNDFLTHISGLRGLAIVMVVLFHLNGQTWSHGYLGVDVFLVITGYLLFRARVKRIEYESLTDMGRFALRRVRRIFPPMLIVILLTVAAGAFLLWWRDESSLCRVGANACVAKANVLLAHEFGNYFAPDSAFMPLLHLWYLSVTLQVYLMWAVGNMVLQRLPLRWVILILSAIGLASLGYNYSFALRDVLNAVGVPVWEQSAGVSYYATLPRLWEVLAGGLVWALPSFVCKKWSTLISGGSLLTIVFLCAPINILGGGIHLPDTLIIVICTVFVIRYLPESCLRCVLSNRVFMWLGGISFSLYLVHMPIIIYGHMWVYGNPSVWYDVALVGISLVVAWGYWWGVEKRPFPWWLVVALWGVSFMVCKYGRSSSGFRAAFSWLETEPEIPTYPQWQRSDRDDLLSDIPEDINVYTGYFYQGPQSKEPLPPPRLLDLGDNSLPPSVVLLGDSHGDHFYAGLDNLFRERGISGVYLATIVCPFRDREYYIDPSYYWNDKKDKALMKWLKAHPELRCVVIAQWWASRFEKEKRADIEDALRVFLRDLKEMGKQVILISDTPEFTSGLIHHYLKVLTIRGMKLGDKLSFSDECTQKEHIEKHKDVFLILGKMEQEGLCKVVEPLKTLRPGESFHAIRGNVSLMLDDNHMSPGLSIEMAYRLWPQLKAALPPMTAPTP